MEHITVFKKEVIDLLQIKPAGTYLDLTLGGGGHSEEIAKKLKHGVLISVDVDEIAINDFISRRLETRDWNLVKSKQKIKISSLQSQVSSTQLYTINDNFENLKSYLQEIGIEKFDGIIADLGWSKDQLGQVEGLSFEVPYEQLDMRFSKDLIVRASDLLNALSKRELKRMFEMYADIFGGNNQKLVSGIIKFRKQKLFEKTEDLLKVIGQSFHKQDKSMTAKIFQALRIAVNRELSILEKCLPEWFELLSNEGRLLIITFHSGEDKVVKKYFDGFVSKSDAKYITKYAEDNYLRPSVEELMENISARSAKLWGLKKLTINNVQ